MGEIISSFAPITLPRATTLQILARDIYQQTNMLGSRQDIVEVLTDLSGKIKVMIPKFSPLISQPSKGCAWNPVEGESAEVREMELCAYVLQKTISGCDFENLCEDINFLGRGNKYYSELAPEANEFILGLLAMNMSAWIGAINNHFWHSYAGFGTTTTPPFYVNQANSKFTPAQWALWVEDMKQCDGIFSQLGDYVADGVTPTVNTNDGTANGNYINSNNIINLLNEMVNKASLVLSLAPTGLFLLQSDLWSAYHSYLVENAQTNPLAYRDLQDLKTDIANGVLMFQGRMVIRMDDWKAFDIYNGAMATSTINLYPITHSLNQRAIFTTPRNFVLGVDSGKNTRDWGMVVQPRADLSDMGAIDVFSHLKQGAMIKSPQDVVFGINSSTTFI